MKATGKLLVAAVAAGGMLAAAQAEAQSNNPVSRGARGTSAMPRSASPAGNAAGVEHGGRNWSRGDGNHGHRGGGHWGGHRWWHGGHHGYRSWYPRWGFYFGVPVFWSAWYWGGPYWNDYYPGGAVVYREVERGAVFPEGEIGPAASTEIPRGEKLPAQGPLYMNYCESAKAYFPKVTTCPEGWKLATPTN